MTKVTRSQTLTPKNGRVCLYQDLWELPHPPWTKVTAVNFRKPPPWRPSSMETSDWSNPALESLFMALATGQLLVCLFLVPKKCLVMEVPGRQGAHDG